MDESVSLGYAGRNALKALLRDDLFPVLLQLLVAWREAAWRNAEALVLAPTPQARALVAQQIETSAAIIGQGIVAGTSYGPLDGLLGRRAARDSYCSTHHG